MKKILSILICVVGISNLFSQTKLGKTTITATAVGNGQVKVDINQPKSATGELIATWTWSNWTNYSDWSENGTKGTTSTGWGHSVSVKLNRFITARKGIEYRVTAYPNTGYYLENWTNLPEDDATSKDNPFTRELDYSNNDVPYSNVTATFKEQTVYKDYANAVAVLVDVDGKPLSFNNGIYQELVGDYTVKVGAEAPGKTCTYNASKSLKTIDNDQGGSWSYTYTAACSDGYEFVGWFEADASGNLPTTDGVIGTSSNTGLVYTKSYPTTTLYSNRANAPIAKTMYAVFRPKLHLYSYIAKDDNFENTPMSPNGVTVNSNTTVFNYTDNVTDGVTNRYYKIVETFDGDVAVSASTGNFTGTIETIQGMTVLHATSNSNAEELSGSITLSVGGTNRVVLTITATQVPIYVTLNPAENLAGKYTYTQNTTGTKEFQVTTAPIQKQMLTATDYSFAFKPQPNDATKYQFDRWIIREADGDVIEDVIPNLSYRFSGGETITPVFIRKDAATYIVKSEPKITYLDLQEALDRAAALKTATGTDQIVVVTSTTGTLLQGDYTIRNGVTFLIPGESTYTALTGDLSEEHFASSGTFKPFCKLTAEDNTTITVKDGNISIYAKLVQINTSQKTSVFEHGHLELGKNCQITVEKGGLYAFGFITGDISSHVTMKSDTYVYEPFFLADWRGGTETTSNWATSLSAGTRARVFPAGQYYVQSVEVPMTLESGAIEKVSCCVNAGVVAAVNMPLIAKYSDAECLFGLGTNTSVIKMYDTATDRLKFAFSGNGATTSQVKVGYMNLKIDDVPIFGTVDVNSKDYVMPVQNNMDIDVKNTTINVLYDVAFLPGSQMRVYDDAIINIGDNNYTAHVYVYDRGARKNNDNTGFWGSGNAIIKPLLSNSRPGGIKVKRTEADLVDARFIINGKMNINKGGLYTVKGAFAGEDTAEPQGGADITSEGSGKVNVAVIGSQENAKQWKQGSGAQTLALTSPKLLLHNDISKGATTNPYTSTAVNVEYTYYQSDGIWQTPKAGITGVKFYDSNNIEIDSLLVTLPTPTTLNGYFLATLEQISGVSYDKNDFVCSFSEGSNFVLADMNNRSIENGKLRVPFTYTVQNKHGKSSHILSINHNSYGELKDTINVVEDYKPVFEVPSDLTIYGRIHETNAGTLPIKHDPSNIVTVTVPTANPTNPKWNAVITDVTPTGAASRFGFHLGTTGNGLDNAYVTFTPNNTTSQKATLKLTAVYTDASGATISSETHTVNLVGNGMIIDNTMEFNNVGTITTSNTNSFNLLRNVNSAGALTCKIVDGDTKTTVPNTTKYTANAIVDIEYTTIDGKGNYSITPKGKVGQVTIEISQPATSTHSAKIITTTIIVVGEPQPLEAQVCLGDDTYQILTEDLDYAEYDAESDQLQFTGDGVISYWTAQFSTAAGVLTFTPHGDGYWAVQESKDGVNWTEIIWWTQLPEGEETYVSLTPTTRRVKISYNKINELGYITDLCINPFSIHAETDKIYVPVKNGVAQPTTVVFTHSAATTPTITPPTGWTATQTTTGNLGGVLFPYYQTIVTISGGTNVAEQNNGFTLTATQGSNNAIATIGTYTFPKPLPMASENWESDGDATNNTNGYDESEYYYHYAYASKNVKWDAERQNVVFLNTGSKVGDDAARQVVFGYAGLPDQMRFQSASTDWTIEQSTNGTLWEEMDSIPTITTVGEVHTIMQPITDDPQYIRITYTGTDQNEVLLNNLVIEGLPSAAPSSVDVLITKTDDNVIPFETFTIHVRNLPTMQLLLDRTEVFKLYYENSSSNWIELTNTDELTSTQNANLALNKEGNVTLKVEWKGMGMLDEGQVQIINPDQNDSVMATIRLVGKKSGITAADANTGIWTGVPDGNPNGTTKVAHTLVDEKDIFVDYTYHQVNLAKAFDTNKKTLFDYLIIFGETTTTDNTTAITQPTKDVGSNAKTPYYVYKKNATSDGYEFINAIANANSSEKGFDGEVIVKDSVTHIDLLGKDLRVYITGFCPYATTGYTKNEEGVFLFRGNHGDKLDIYLDSCHIYSRNKSEKGTNFYGNKEGGEIYSDAYARGSGGVLVFENMDKQEQLENYDPFEVSIHTIGHNLLNSNYGCFFGLKLGNSVAMKAYQVSSPIQVHMPSKDHIRTTKTTLNFDDVWPTVIDASNNITATKRTNGFLALKKQANNAPSIDMGNQYTEVNFNGGQIQLQNSQIGSDTYRTTLAISYRAGLFGAEEAGIQLCHGIGTDAVDGTVNFLDGTVTVERMKIADAYRQYYLMDTLADGTETEYTTCLRTPKNTYIKGGSVCRVRACQSVTSKGGGPKEGVGGRLLGQYVYTFDNTKDTKDNTTGLATITGFPSNITGLETYAYNLNSVTPDANNQFYFWIPDSFGGVTAEKDVYMATWKACMTQIGAGIAGVAEGTVGGDILINEEEEVKYFLYCQLDDNIYNVINAGTEVDGKKNYTYQAPIEVPSAAKEFFNGKYTRWAPNLVGGSKQHQVTSEKPYTITDRVYYITTATADLWQTFTAPFDVENIYVVETFKEEMLELRGNRSDILQAQAQHNADFAAFFGVAMAMGTMNSFDQIYDSYIEWAKIQDRDSLRTWNGQGTYNLRGKTKLIPYTGKNWREANFYLNHNNGNWDMTIQEDSLRTKWEVLKQSDIDDGILLHKGETYSLMFPYCTGCEFEFSERTYWDYWSGKFLIFESTDAPQTINGHDFLDDTKSGNIFAEIPSGDEVIVTGNSTFSYLTTNKSNVYRYADGHPSMLSEGFVPVTPETIVYPVTAFLYGIPANSSGMPARKITRSGKIIYDVDNNGDGTTTGGNIPTVGGGNDLFITSTATGINIAVAEPQQVRVMSATGATLFSGMVQTAVDVFLPTAGVYVVAGDNEVHKILH